VPVLSPGDHAPAIDFPACTPGRRNARLTGRGDHRGRWVVLGFLPREERVDPTFLRTLADLGAVFTFTRPVVLVASPAPWGLQAARHADDGHLDGLVDHLLADDRLRLTAAYGVLGPDGDCRRAAVVIDPAGTVRQVVAELTHDEAA
jgi:alkyl hydroperoxide reductase subunit AhpC